MRVIDGSLDAQRLEELIEWLSQSCLRDLLGWILSRLFCPQGHSSPPTGRGDTPPAGSSHAFEHDEL